MTVRKNASGSWMIDVQMTMPDGSRTRVRKVCPVQTEQAAVEYERTTRERLFARAQGSQTHETASSAPKFSRAAECFVESRTKADIRPSTAREKGRALRRGLLGHFGGLRLDEIRTKHVEEFKERRKRDGVGAKTINEELGILAQVLRNAQDRGVLEVPLPRIQRLEVESPPLDYLSFEEAGRLSREADRAPSPWCSMIPVALLTGLRLGELRALQWDDVDLAARELHVRRTADDRNVLHPAGGRARCVDLPLEAAALLRGHGHRLGSFVFCRRNGSILSNWDCGSRSTEREGDGPLARVCRKAGVRRVGWRVLRHSYAAHLVMRGASLVEVQKLLGHASLDATARYAHLSPGSREGAAALLDDEPAAALSRH